MFYATGYSTDMLIHNAIPSNIIKDTNGFLSQTSILGDLLVLISYTNVFIYFCFLFSAGIGRTGTFIVIDILIDIIREKGKAIYIKIGIGSVIIMGFFRLKL